MQLQFCMAWFLDQESPPLDQGEAVCGIVRTFLPISRIQKGICVSSVYHTETDMQQAKKNKNLNHGGK